MHYSESRDHYHPGAAPALAHAVSCLVVDEHEIVREGLRLALSRTRFRIVGEASSCDVALAMVARRRPAIVVMGLRLGDDDGVDVAAELRRRHPETRVLIFTGVADPTMVPRGRAAGCAGYLAKTACHATIVVAHERVAAGGEYLDGAFAELLLAPDAREALSVREREVLTLLADGLTSHDTCQQLFISEETLKSHVHRILDKLQAHSRAHAIAIALRRRIIA